MNHALAIAQPGIAIRITQPYYKVGEAAAGPGPAPIRQCAAERSASMS